ncbi:hypothetical protein A3736_13740 [Erythrobacter sp. HI0063]|jgi:hypothetical protein|uniref:hypothetical protein n=1 Tax=Erythrobacter sp. HI0063 TaxID=1822240 RepID=UPI0007C248EC|nr:hypothetical protein [Erythrobacter sp. HI0063]KZY54664.1 hypothetical protein A3736_13740 [Erythrobacter sp. HI0063]
MRKLALLVLPLALPFVLAACSSQEPAPADSAEDFASRVGAPGTSTTGGTAVVVAPQTVETTAARIAPPPNTDVTQLERLGNIGGVDLGPRAGGCTFSAAGQEMLVAAGPSDRSLPGKATVRAGGKLILLDAPPGGYDQVKAGTTFNGEGFSVLVQPTGRDTGQMTITDVQGRQKSFNGRWVCS